jgi:tetratricopeptide (TPR) repeat protein
MLVVAVFASLVLAAPACAANGKWLRAESKHFIAYGEVSERELREAVRELETLDSVLRWYLVVDANAEDGAKLEYYLVKNMNGIRLAQPSLDRQVAGFYMARPDVIAAVGMARDGGGYEGAGRQILFHEYAHHFMFQHFPGSYPTWYVEGFAEYISSINFDRRQINIGALTQSTRDQLVNETWLDFDKVFTAKMSDLATQDRLRFYALAWATMHYMLSDAARGKQLTEYISLMRGGVASKEAFEKAFSATYAQIGQQVKAYLYKGLAYRQIDSARVSLASASEVAVTPMPASADTLLLPLLRIRLKGVMPAGASSSDRAALYAEMKAKATPLAGDPFADRVLAYTEIYFGDPARAKPWLDAALARDPNDVDALYLMGVMYLAQAEGQGEREIKNLTEGRAYLGRLFKITDSNVPMLYYYAMSYMKRGRPTENQVNVLLRAQSLAPQVVEIGICPSSDDLRQRSVFGSEALAHLV